MLSIRKRKKKLYSGANAPMMYAVLDATIRQALASPQDNAFEALVAILSEPDQMAVLKRLKDK